ncbi:pyrroline-5-carboxylate reductase [Ruminiclostridium sufflavum DSM 19573]|uniref:Pyrroline-5-carboxylate reductase n=1 Tax=Ruminiclostridium sufflavum DSM 19573 TaxID=1121337 RepID=A0A318XJV0_9FIRM|nr:pyrroline-5-carboxylate reductase [Ruminiclostridium sufflavum]PYG87600.1 pyrroline-5-carboxylate reductase [Ruminiclostridium sufflavum DSM 19573]
MNKIGFIGTGAMGSAMIKGIIKAEIVTPSDIFVYDVDKQKLNLLCRETGINAAADSIEVVKACDYTVLAVKPNIVKKVLSEIKDVFSYDKVFISIAAGIPLKTYKGILGESRKVIRALPNTPAIIGEGMTLISFDGCVKDDDINNAVSILGALGKVECMEERLMSEVVALTSSSPAYIFMLIEAMADAAVLSGIPRQTAYRLASQAVAGSAKMVAETGKHPGELKDQVCSPAGTTIEAVAALEMNGFRNSVIQAMNECTKRARELGNIYG